MATTRSAADERKLSNRLNGVMKKANDLFTMFDVNVAFYVLDGDNLWSYQSRPDWPSEMKDMGGAQKTPNDFITHSEHLRNMSVELCSSQKSSSQATPYAAKDGFVQLQSMMASPQSMIEPVAIQEVHPYTAGISLPSTHLSSAQEVTTDQEERLYALGHTISLSVDEQTECPAGDIPQQDQDRSSPTAKKSKRGRQVVMTAAGQRGQRKDIYGFTGGKR